MESWQRFLMVGGGWLVLPCPLLLVEGQVMTTGTERDGSFWVVSTL